MYLSVFWTPTIILCTCWLSQAHVQEGWINPHDMNVKPDTSNYKNPHEMTTTNVYYPEKSQNSEKPTNDVDYLKKSPPQNYSNERTTEAYLKRMVQLLLNAVHENALNENTFNGYLFVDINIEDYQYLKSIANVNLDLDNLVQVDRILSKILRKPMHQDLQDYLETKFHKFLNLMLSREGISAIVVVVYAFVIYKMFRAQFFTWYVFYFLVVNFLILDFVFTWVQLYKKAEIETFVDQMKYKNIPVECNPEQMTSWQFVINIFRQEDECKKYHKVMYQDIFWTISPGTVAMEMFSHVIQYPAKSIGVAVGDICSGMLNAFPWPLNYIMLPILLLFFCVLMCIILTFTLSVPFKFNLFHLISFSFGQTERRHADEGVALRGRAVEQLLDLAMQPRRMVENVKFTKKRAVLPKTNGNGNCSEKSRKTPRNDNKEQKAIKSKLEDDKKHSRSEKQRKVEVGAGDSK